MKRIALVLLLAVLLTGCAPKPPMGAIVAAFHFCPVDECSNVVLGSTSKQLPYSEAGITDKWCVDVKFTRDGKAQRAAVLVVQTSTTAAVGYGDWAAADPVYNSDCGVYK